MEDFNSQCEGLEFLKPGVALKGAPRMWSLLSRVLSGAGVLPARIDPQLHVKHNSAGELLILLSVHVDDLKMTGKPDEVDALLAMLNKEFDQLPDVAAYVASLQRKLQDPCARDILNINRVFEIRSRSACGSGGWNLHRA